jgi:hypothetical protein
VRLPFFFWLHATLNRPNKCADRFCDERQSFRAIAVHQLARVEAVVKVIADLPQAGRKSLGSLERVLDACSGGYVEDHEPTIVDRGVAEIGFYGQQLLRYFRGNAIFWLHEFVLLQNEEVFKLLAQTSDGYYEGQPPQLAFLLPAI